MSLVWTDIETTGLDRDTCALLEVAAIVTDDALNEVARFERVVSYPVDPFGCEALMKGNLTDEVIEGWSRRSGITPFVIRMHAANGMWMKCTSDDAASVYNVDRDFAQFIAEHAQHVVVLDTPDANGNTRIDKPQLAGSTISFDRGFIEKHLPRVNEALHYRNVDVSTLNELGRRFWPEIYAARPNNKDKAHRGMADIEESIRVCKHYLACLVPGVHGTLTNIGGML